MCHPGQSISYQIVFALLVYYFELEAHEPGHCFSLHLRVQVLLLQICQLFVVRLYEEFLSL